MKKFASVFVMCVLALPAFASVTGGSQARRSNAQQWMSAPRATASTNQLQAMASVNNGSDVDTTSKASVRAETPSAPVPADKKNSRDKERSACINNNIGIGDTFVWASRYGNTSSYASMVEDVDEPDNNTCFVKVEMKSADPKINVDDVPARYYEMGRVVTCGSWANEETMRQRILDSKKSARVWATVGASVGGAAIGVGAMELFGNKLIGGNVEGQKGLKGDELLRSQFAALAKDEPTQHAKLREYLTKLKTECDNWSGGDKPEACSKYDYNNLLRLM